MSARVLVVDDSNLARRSVRRTLEAAGFKLDYLEVRDAETLQPAGFGTGRPLRVLVAAWLGKTRLIDNVAVQISGSRDQVSGS